MAAHEVTLYITVGEPEVGLWCNTCRVKFPVHQLTEDGVSQMRPVFWCIEHEQDT